MCYQSITGPAENTAPSFIWHIIGRLLCHMKAVFLLFTLWSSWQKIIECVVVITFRSGILTNIIINCCAVICCLQTHWSVTQTGFTESCSIFVFSQNTMYSPTSPPNLTRKYIVGPCATKRHRSVPDLTPLLVIISRTTGFSGAFQNQYKSLQNSK